MLPLIGTPYAAPVFALLRLRLRVPVRRIVVVDHLRIELERRIDFVQRHRESRRDRTRPARSSSSPGCRTGRPSRAPSCAASRALPANGLTSRLTLLPVSFSYASTTFEKPPNHGDWLMTIGDRRDLGPPARWARRRAAARARKQQRHSAPRRAGAVPIRLRHELLHGIPAFGVSGRLGRLHPVA